MSEKKAPAKKKKSVKKKAAPNGGYRPRKKAKYREQELIAALIEYCGGPSKVSETLKVSPAVVVNWRLRGQVAAALVNKAAKFFRVDGTLLNYHFGKEAGEKFSWDKGVKGLSFLKPDVKARICSLPSRMKSA